MERVRLEIGAERRVEGGLGITVGVLDSGVEEHPDLVGKISLFRDFVGNASVPYDDNGHGTHVCGMIAGRGSRYGGLYMGIVPGCSLVVGKVLDRQGNGRAEHMLAGLDWMAEQRKRYGIRILNISVGIGELEEPEKENRLCQKLEELWDLGMVIVCAAGNKGPAEGSLSALGKSGKVITVGCHDKKNGRNARSCRQYSGRGWEKEGMPVKPDLVAPGTEVISCNAGWKQGMYYIAKSGTSMSTPLVSAAAALLLEQHPELTNEEVKRRLHYSATDLGEPWSLQGWGLLNVKKLLEKY